MAQQKGNEKLLQLNLEVNQICIIFDILNSKHYRYGCNYLIAFSILHWTNTTSCKTIQER